MTLILPVEKVAAIEALRDNGHPLEKFSRNPQGWVDEAEEIAIGLGLHLSFAYKVLDVGCGYSYFLWVCQQYRCAVLGMDLPEPLLLVANDILGVPWVPGRVSSLDGPFPLPHHKYHLVTTFGVNFRQPSTDKYWTASDYHQFSERVRAWLMPNGRWVLRPNQTDDPTSPIAKLMDRRWWQEVLKGTLATINVSNIEGSVTIRWPIDDAKISSNEHASEN